MKVGELIRRLVLGVPEMKVSMLRYPDLRYPYYGKPFIPKNLQCDALCPCFCHPAIDDECLNLGDCPCDCHDEAKAARTLVL